MEDPSAVDVFLESVYFFCCCGSLSRVSGQVPLTPLLQQDREGACVREGIYSRWIVLDGGVPNLPPYIPDALCRSTAYRISPSRVLIRQENNWIFSAAARSQATVFPRVWPQTFLPWTNSRWNGKKRTPLLFFSIPVNMSLLGGFVVELYSAFRLVYGRVKLVVDLIRKTREGRFSSSSWQILKWSSFFGEHR